MVLISVIAGELLFCAAVVLYIRNAFKSPEKPALGMWVLFSSATFLNVLSMFVHTSGESKALSNMFSIVDFSACIVVVCALTFSHVALRVEKFERKYFWGIPLIISFWIFTKDEFSANLLSQGLIVLGYFPTLHKIMKNGRNTEPFFPWGLNLAATLVSFYPAYAEHNILAEIYAWRSLIQMSSLLLIMYMYKRN